MISIMKIGLQGYFVKIKMRDGIKQLNIEDRFIFIDKQSGKDSKMLGIIKCWQTS